MNKIVCLLVASLVSVAVANRVDPTYVAINDAVVKVNAEVSEIEHGVRQMAVIHGSHLSATDIHSLLNIRTEFTNILSSILRRSGVTASQLAGRFTTLLFPVKHNFVEDLDRSRSNAEPPSDAIRDTMNRLSVLLVNVPVEIDAILEAAFELTGRVALTEAAIKAAVAAVGPQLTTLAAEVRGMSGIHGSELTPRHAQSVEKIGTYLEGTLASIQTGNGGNESQVAAKFASMLNRLKSKVIPDVERIGARFANTNPRIRAAVTRIPRSFNEVQIQIDAILNASFRLAPSGSG